jgi:DNA adenine methylase
MEPPRAVLSDLNPELIDLYSWVKRDPDRLVNKVWRFSNTAECFYKTRASRPRTSLGRAARMLYLSRTSFGGIYRLNKSGEFNVPFGRSGRVVCRRAPVRTASEALRTAELLCADFEAVIDMSGEGDVVYADPPFHGSEDCRGFRRYNDKTFTWADQERLAKAVKRASARGAFIVVSLPWQQDILQLYSGFIALRADRQSRVSRSLEGRGRVAEAVLFSRAPRSGLLRIPSETDMGGNVALAIDDGFSSVGESDRPDEALSLSFLSEVASQ